ncbi:hypothetical protein ABIC75_004150 [Dyella japonica]|uniref:Uncharacterized protein n=1 Tax=Dyella japonica TaxID=231455 RepID=A0ABV2K001_9GAMM
MATQSDISYHYDVDNAFYELFLDKAHMAYSCGVWDGPLTLSMPSSKSWPASPPSLTSVRPTASWMWGAAGVA